MLNKLKEILLSGEVIFKNEAGEITSIGTELEDGVILAIEVESGRIFVHYLDDNEEIYCGNLLQDIFDLVEEE